LPDNILVTLQDLIREDMNVLADHMSVGGCASWDEYNVCVGKVQGLASSERHLLDLVEKQKLAEQGDT